MSQDDLVTALSGLTPAERIELLQLLEARDREPVIEDTRPSVVEMMRKSEEAEAKRAGADVEAYMAAWDAHQACRDTHMSALWDHPLAPGMSMDEYFAQGLDTWSAASEKADELAAAEGCPCPDLNDFMGKPAADEQSACADTDDILEQMMTASGSPATRQTVVTRPQQPAHDKLGPFRGRDTSTEPGWYEDN